MPTVARAPATPVSRPSDDQAMRITRNKTPGTCPLCKQPLEAGTLGAPFSVTSTQIRRGHPECINRWRQQRLAEARMRAML